MHFENIQVPIDDLPSMESLDFRSLEKRQLRVDLIGMTIFSLVLMFAFYMSLIFPKHDIDTWILLIAGVGLFIVLSFFFYLVFQGFFRKKYALRSRDILYKEGVFWRSTTAIPFHRVQHCEVKEGPIQRWFGLSTLVVYTAGGHTSDLKIPGLNPGKAQSIRSFILNKSAAVDEEE